MSDHEYKPEIKQEVEVETDSQLRAEGVPQVPTNRPPRVTHHFSDQSFPSSHAKQQFAQSPLLETKIDVMGQETLEERSGRRRPRFMEAKIRGNSFSHVSQSLSSRDKDGGHLNNSSANYDREQVFNVSRLRLDTIVSLASASKNEKNPERLHTSAQRQGRERMRDREPRQTDSFRDSRRNIQEDRERRPEYQEGSNSDADRDRSQKNIDVNLVRSRHLERVPSEFRARPARKTSRQDRRSIIGENCRDKIISIARCIFAPYIRGHMLDKESYKVIKCQCVKHCIKYGVVDLRGIVAKANQLLNNYGLSPEHHPYSGYFV